MASSTRNDVIARVKRRLRVQPHSDMDGDILSLNNVIDEIATNISRRTRCFMTNYTTDITGTSATPATATCIPEIYEITGLLATYGTSTTQGFQTKLLHQVGIESANAYMRQWQQNPAQGFPQYFIYVPPLVYLYPQPNYTCTGGLVFEGYAAPLASWQQGTTSPAVPERVIDAIVDGAAGKWGVEYGEIPGMMEKATAFTAAYEEAVGLLQSEINRQHDRAREDRRRLWGY